MEGNNDLGILGKKSYNPNAPDWSMVPSVTEVNDFLPQSQSLASSIVS